MIADVFPAAGLAVQAGFEKQVRVRTIGIRAHPDHMLIGGIRELPARSGGVRWQLQLACCPTWEEIALIEAPFRANACGACPLVELALQGHILGGGEGLTGAAQEKAAGCIAIRFQGPNEGIGLPGRMENMGKKDVVEKNRGKDQQH